MDSHNRILYSEEISSLQTQIQSQQKEIERLRSDGTAIETKLEALARELSGLRSMIKEKDRRIGELSHKLAEQEKELLSLARPADKHQWYDDITQGSSTPFVYRTRFNMLDYWGFTREKLNRLCNDVFKYKQYVIDIVMSENERDLHENHNQAWHRMRKLMEKDNMENRRNGRDCYTTAKDILADGLFTDVLLHRMRELFPELNIKKNEQDEVLELKDSVSNEPDFVINGLYRLEMKISQDHKDAKNRSKWTNKTLTIRPENLQSELLRYKDFPNLYFLRINHSDRLCCVIKYTDFRPSFSKDGSYYAKYNVKKYCSDFDKFLTTIRNLISEQIGV